MGSKQDRKFVNRLLKLAEPLEKKSYEELERLMAPYLDQVSRGELEFVSFFVLAGTLFRGDDFQRYIQANVARDIREAQYQMFQQLGADKAQYVRDALIGAIAA